MTARLSEIEKINQSFYNKLYGKRNPLLLLAHPLISFDQQSKSKRNFRILKPLLAERSASRQTPPPSMLDYGFGHGSLLLKFPRTFRLFGCDLSSEAVASLGYLSRMLGRKMDLCTVDEFEKRTESERFDFITCSHVLEHVPDDVATLKMLADRLAHKGWILINLPINEVWEDPNHIRPYDPESARALFEKCSLRMTSSLECDRWTAFFLKHEMIRPLPRPLRPLLRALRLLFAILPLTVVDVLEKAFAGTSRPQQFLALVEKAS